MDKFTELLALLAQQRITAKRQEDAAASIRKALDTEIAGLMVDASKPEGAVSMRLEEAGVKLTVTYGLTRTANTEAVEAAWESLPAKVKDAFRFKASVVDAKARELTDQDALEYSKLVTTKPASPSVKLELI